MWGRKLILGMTTVLLLAILISCTNATKVETVTVEPLTKKMLIFDLDKGDKFSGTLAISGGANNDINFWITDPQGDPILRLDGISGGGFEFTAQESGAYTFHFDNTFSLTSSKTVNLSYDISRPALLDIVWALIIIGVLFMAIAIIIGVLLYRRKKQTILKPSQSMSPKK